MILGYFEFEREIANKKFLKKLNEQTKYILLCKDLNFYFEKFKKR